MIFKTDTTVPVTAYPSERGAKGFFYPNEEKKLHVNIFYLANCKEHPSWIRYNNYVPFITSGQVAQQYNIHPVIWIEKEDYERFIIFKEKLQATISKSR